MHRSRAPRAALALVTFALLIRMPARAASEDPANGGKRVFHACQACHAVDARGTTDSGPTLYRLFGRRAGTAEGFGYSDALRTSGIVWSETTLDAFLKNPQACIPGNAMPSAGVSNAADRALLIAYLKILTVPVELDGDHTEK